MIGSLVFELLSMIPRELDFGKSDLVNPAGADMLLPPPRVLAALSVAVNDTQHRRLRIMQS